MSVVGHAHGIRAACKRPEFRDEFVINALTSVHVDLDIFWLRDKSLEESDDLPEPDVLAQEIADDLQTALEQFTAIAEKLKS